MIEPDYHYDEKDQLIDQCRDIVKDILRELYSSDSIDYKSLQWDVEEICHVLNMKIPQNELTIRRVE